MAHWFVLIRELVLLWQVVFTALRTDCLDWYDHYSIGCQVQQALNRARTIYIYRLVMRILLRDNYIDSYCKV